MCQLSDYSKLNLCKDHRQILELELDLWHKVYLTKDLTDKVVLDLGAGCGETTLFYLLHGAKRVIAVESSFDCFLNILKNFHINQVTPIHNHIDMIKCDIEGSEEGMIVESHHSVTWSNIQIYPHTTNWHQLHRTYGLNTILYNILHNWRLLWLSIRSNHFKNWLAHQIRLRILK